MDYKKANGILPENLLDAVQDHIDGEYLTVKFGRNTNFDKDFLLQNMMGPNCVRIAEDTHTIQLRPHMRVLDLGCGTG